MIYHIFRAMARLGVFLFFRRVQVEGKESIPPGPVLLVSNHTNALVDPLLPLVLLNRRLTLTGKNVLKSNPLLALITWATGAISFHRPEDAGKGAHPRENVRSMQRCREVLAGGGAVLIFPEGISHSDLAMRPFRVGAAKLALDYVRKEQGGQPLQIVPVGLLYSSKSRFRSDVWIRFGEPLDVKQWISAQAEPSAPQLNDELRRRIESLTIAYPSRREMLIVNWASDVIATGGRTPSLLGATNPRVTERFETLRRLQAGYRALGTSQPRISALADRVRDYRRELKRRGIEPDEVYLPINVFRALFFLMSELELIVVGTPLALFGIINHLLPYVLVRQVARRLSKDTDQWASNVIYPSLVIFPFFYCLQIAAAWLLLPTLWACIYCVALPYTGYYTILYSERVGSARRRATTFIYFLFHPEVRQRLARQGREIIDSIRLLADDQHPQASLQ